MKSNRLTSYIIVFVAVGFGLYHLWLVGQVALRLLLVRN